MPAHVGYSREQLFRSQILLGLVQEYMGPAAEFQRFYNLGIGAVGRRILGRTGAYDISNPPRNLAQPRTPSVPEPLQIRQKVYGHVPYSTVRFYEEVTLREEDFMVLRAPGANIGTIDPSGQQFIAQETAQLVNRNRQAREFMATRMMMGGFGIQRTGDVENMVEPTVTGDNVFTVDSRVPADHKGDGPVDGKDGSNGIFVDKWSNAATDIIDQFMRLDAWSTIVHGAEITEIWINSTAYNYLINNTGLREVRGTALRVFDRNTKREIDPESGVPDTGFDVTFQALPRKVFHVYNAGYVAGDTTTDLASQTSSANFQRFIPDGKAIMTPKPGPWCGVISGSEPVCKRKDNLNSEMVYGFDIWSDRTYRPPGQTITTIDNVITALYQPSAVYYVDIFTP